MHPTFMHKFAPKHTQNTHKHSPDKSTLTQAHTHTHKYTQTPKKFPSIAKAVSDSFQMHPIF